MDRFYRCRMIDDGQRLDDADWEQRPVVELEFRGGPLSGRRMLGPGGVRLLFFAGFGIDRRPLLSTSIPASGSALGCYAFEAAFESTRRHECVVVLRWERTLGDSPAD